MSEKNKIRNEGYKDSPVFPERVYQLIATILFELVHNLKNYGRQMDIAFFSTIAMLSACFPKLYGIYFGKRVYSNLYCIVCGPPASGKSVMLFGKSIGDKIDSELMRLNKEDRERYRQEMAVWSANPSGLPPIEPTDKHLLFPGNSTEAGVYVLLSRNEGRGAIVETETDVLVKILGQQHGDYSVVLRKGFHHESATAFRKTNSEFISIECPRITLLLSGTLDQLPKLINSAENGLFSRLASYAYDDKPIFSNPFSTEHLETVALFDNFGEFISSKYFDSLEGKEREFKLTEDQQNRLIAKFPAVVDEFYYESGSEGVSIPIRMALIFFRIAMILSAVRNIDVQDADLVCNDNDFEAAELIVDVLLIHSQIVFSSLPSNDEEAKELLSDEALLRILPETFESRAVAKYMAEKHGYSKRTAFRAIKKLVEKGLIHKTKLGHYRKGRQGDSN
jgi:hypothetical protein